jgi:hypothetical protein
LNLSGASAYASFAASRRCLRAVPRESYFPSLISMEETLLIPPVMVLLTCSVLMEMDCTLMSVANRFVNTWATSTAREMALPLAFTVTTFDPLLICVRQAST